MTLPLDPNIEFNTHRVRQGIDAEMSQMFTAERLGVLNNATLARARGGMVDFLRRLQMTGDIPEDVNVMATRAVTYEIDPASIDLQLPVLLQLYMGDGAKSVRTQRYQHDADCCRFLAHGLGCDLYHCHQHGLPTVIARRSSEGSDYVSGMVVAQQTPVSEPLGLAYRLAVEAELEPELTSATERMVPVFPRPDPPDFSVPLVSQADLMRNQSPPDLGKWRRR